MKTLITFTLATMMYEAFGFWGSLGIIYLVFILWFIAEVLNEYYKQSKKENHEK